MKGIEKENTAESALIFLFPGQGSQQVGMGSAWRARNPIVQRTYEEAEQAFGGGLLQLMSEGPLESLTATEVAQPAILTVSTAYARVLAEAGIQPDYVLGHSLGEYSALVSSGALDFSDAVRLTRLRGKAMQEAVPVGVGTMTALVGARDTAKVRALCDACAEDEVLEPAGFNCPGQVVLAGNMGAIERAEKRAKEFGCGVAKRLTVSAPFHCSLLSPAGERLAAALEEVEVRDPNIPYVANVDSELVRHAEGVRARLVDQVSKPVLFQQSVELLGTVTNPTWLEVGAGKTLSGLVKRTLRGSTVDNFEAEKWLAS